MNAAPHSVCANSTPGSPQVNGGRLLAGRERRALLTCVAGGRPTQDAVQWSAVVEAARRHRVAPLIAPCLERTGLPEQARLRLDEVLNKCRERTQRAYRGLAPILGEAQRRRLPLVVFKGPVLSEALYSRPDLRPFFDIDLLVQRDNLESAERLLVDLGYELQVLQSSDLRWMLESRTLPQEEKVLTREETRALYLAHHFHLPYVPLDPDRGMRVDLHWAFFPADRLSLPMAEFWERAVPVEVGGQSALTFCPADTLLYLCLHTSLDGYAGVRLIKLLDIVRAAHRLSDREWAELARRARQYGVERPFFLALWLSHRALGRRLPEAAGGMKPISLRRNLLAAALSDRALLSGCSPWAQAAWDWALGGPGPRLILKMFKTAARQWVHKVAGRESGDRACVL